MVTSHANNVTRDKKEPKGEGRQKPFFFLRKIQKRFCMRFLHAIFHAQKTQNNLDFVHIDTGAKRIVQAIFFANGKNEGENNGR